MNSNKVTAMLLAGGQGSRLKMLTQDLAKPAVPFGGKYRIIDFPLSNCSNSGISNVGILTQYKPFMLNSHIGIGTAWDLDRRYGGVRVLPPYMNEEGGRWFRGTANAIFENINYLDQLNTKYVLVLSGDHIYKMDYSKLIDAHVEKNADATISVIPVPWDEASRFGVLSVDKDDKITEFQEKPDKPNSNLASMGIYVFNWATLKEYLIEDENNPESTNDFGHDIIPKYKNDKRNLYAYEFNGYWKDVGTVKSYWEANMDMLNDSDLDLYDSSWRIYTTSKNLPPHFISSKAKVKNSLINEGCVVKAIVNDSVLFYESEVDEGSIVEDSVILPKTKIGKNCRIKYAVIMENTIIKDNTEIIGTEDNILLAGSDSIVES